MLNIDVCVIFIGVVSCQSWL